MKLHVQFSDETEAKIVSWFSSPQLAGSFEFTGEVEPDDPRYIFFLDTLTDDMSASIPD